MFVQITRKNSFLFNRKSLCVFFIQFTSSSLNPVGYDDCSGSAYGDKLVARRSETSSSLLSPLHVSCSLTVAVVAAADDAVVVAAAVGDTDVVGADDSKLSAAADDNRARTMRSKLEVVVVVVAVFFVAG